VCVFFCPETGQDIHSSLKFCPVRKFCLSSCQKSSQNERYLSDTISCWSLRGFSIFFFPYRFKVLVGRKFNVDALDLHVFEYLNMQFSRGIISSIMSSSKAKKVISESYYCWTVIEITKNACILKSLQEKHFEN